MDDKPHTRSNDRLGIHFAWEAGLFLCSAGLLFALLRSATGPFADAGWAGFALALAPVLLAATATAASMRVGAVNLAAGPIAFFSGWLFIDASGSGLAIALGMSLGAAFFMGVATALLNTWLRIPSWATSIVLGGSLILIARGTPSTFMAATLQSKAVYAALGAAVGLSLLLGFVGAVPSLRDKLQANRDTAGDDWRPHPWITVLGVILSCLAAGGAGVVFAWGSSTADAAVLVDPVEVGLAAFAAALLGGTSPFGRRGGFTGTFLASTAILAAMWFAESRGWFDPLWVALGAIVFGFIVSRFIETWNSAEEEEASQIERAGDVDDLKEDDTTVLPAPRSELGSGSGGDDDFAAMATGTNLFGDAPGADTGSQKPVDPFGEVPASSGKSFNFRR
ncbi:hypothetical protein [Salininema proteolyticum]|uniref:Monosaccharide ABC transporter membrane protein, CUT2 family n=1 Tax=Salininema proteolyticum TaxID=1607685 RepID=A0ABV8U2V5_9ACTN